MSDKKSTRKPVKRTPPILPRGKNGQFLPAAPKTPSRIDRPKDLEKLSRG